MNEKPHKTAISLVFKESDKVLALKRSPNKESFPNAWSIPSTYIHEGESPSDAANRLVKRKLNLESVTLEETPIGTSGVVDRGKYTFEMTDYTVKEYTGDISYNTDEYTGMRWVTKEELLTLINTENNGEMGECTRTFLTSEEVL